MVALLLVLAACQDSSTGDTSPADAVAAPLNEGPRRYKAEWFINAEAVNVEGPGYPFVYREIVDDRTGRYLVQSPNHLAVQTPDEVIFCAAILRDDPYCASSPRAEGTPNVLSYPIQLLRGWGPRALYDLASYREVEMVAKGDRQNWDTRFATIGETDVECFTVVGETTAAETGFDICYTDDDLHLVASVDLQSDLVYEIDLISYSHQVGDSDFETGLEQFVEARPSLQEQLLALYPEVPAQRPAPTAVPDSDQ
jgi:hypothetical protein